MKLRSWPGSLLTLSILLAVLVVNGCAAARKPATPEKVVVPEVTKIFFEKKDLAQAPPVMRDLAERYDGKEAQLAVLAEGNVWVLVAAEESDDRLEIEEVTQRIVAEDLTVLEIRLVETEQEAQADKTGQNKVEPLLARLNTKTIAGGVIFYIEELEKEGERTASPSATAAKADKQPAAVQQQLMVDLPKANDNVSSPLEVTGKAQAVAGTIKVKLLDSEGNLLAETETLPQAGKFRAVLNYEQPQAPAKGRLEVAEVNPKTGKEENAKVIPLTIH